MFDRATALYTGLGNALNYPHMHSDAKTKLDLTTWPRKPHFDFFSTFEEPYYGLTVRIDCTAAYRYAKSRGISFFLYCVYQATSAAQQIEPLRMRIHDGEAYIYDIIDAGSIVDRPNGTFGIGYYPYDADLDAFLVTATAEFSAIRSRTDLVRKPFHNVIRFSSLPWIDFTSLSHARLFSALDSCPSITFGKMTEQNGLRTMPLSIHVHHALVDGLHVGQYLDALQLAFNSR